MKVSMVRNKTRKLLVTKTESVLHSQLGSTKTAIKQLLPTSFIVRCLHYTREIDWATIHNWHWLWKDSHYIHLHYSFYQSSVHLCLPDATDRMQKCCSDLFPPVYGWRGWVLLVALCEECGPAEDSVNTAATSSSVQTLCYLHLHGLFFRECNRWTLLFTNHQNI